MTIYRLKLFAAVVAGLAFAVSPASAEQSEARAVFKAMSDFLTAQQSVSVGYDATLEIVTAEMMKVGLASSGNLSFSRPDKIRMTRTGGIADVEMVYDGKTLSAYGKTLNVFGKLPLEGKVDDVIAMLRDEFGLELPAADLLSSAPYEVMMENVIDARALGEGMIRGQMCDHLAFRTSRCRLADLGGAGREAISLPLHDHQQDDGSGAVLQHRVLGLEERRGDRRG